MLDKPEGPVDNLPFKWFEGALLNYAENLLRHDDDKVAVYSFGKHKAIMSKFINDIFIIILYKKARRFPPSNP